MEQDICINELLHLSRAISEEDIALILETFEKHISNDRDYLAITEIPEGYEEFDSRMDQLCAEDIEILTQMIEKIKNNVRPSREECSRLAHLRVDTYGDLVAGYMNYMMGLLQKMVTD